MSVLHLLQLHQVPILEQLKIEEALLRTDQRNWCLINHGSSPAIVMGISGKPIELIHSEKWKQHPVPLIRRFSGGGTVFIDQNTCFVTFICNTNFVPISPFPESIMRWTAQLYKPVFAPLPFTLKENDYTLNEKKFGGNAQSICKNRWLHHSSFLWDYTPQHMDYLLFPKKTPSYRQQRIHSDFLCRLKDHWPHAKTFTEKLCDHLDKEYELAFVKLEEIKPLLDQPHRKATTLLQGLD